MGFSPSYLLINCFICWRKIVFMSISFLFLRLKRKEIDERKEKERYERQGYRPEPRFLFMYPRLGIVSGSRVHLCTDIIYSKSLPNKGLKPLVEEYINSA